MKINDKLYLKAYRRLGKRYNKFVAEAKKTGELCTITMSKFRKMHELYRGNRRYSLAFWSRYYFRFIYL